MQIDAIGPVEGTELMKCKLYIDGRPCKIMKDTFGKVIHVFV